MDNTIQDLYLKYVGSVGEALEDDRYFQYLFEMVQAGNTTLKQNHQVPTLFIRRIRCFIRLSMRDG